MDETHTPGSVLTQPLLLQPELVVEEREDGTSTSGLEEDSFWGELKRWVNWGLDRRLPCVHRSLQACGFLSIPLRVDSTITVHLQDFGIGWPSGACSALTA